MFNITSKNIYRFLFLSTLSRLLVLVGFVVASLITMIFMDSSRVAALPVEKTKIDCYDVELVKGQYYCIKKVETK